MSLRTYPLIVHPAFLTFVESELGRDKGLHQLPANLTPLALTVTEVCLSRTAEYSENFSTSAA